MLDAIRYNLANLANLNGRDARPTFWFYVLFLVLAQFAVSLVASVPLYVSIFSAAFEAGTQGGGNAAMLSSVNDMVEDMRILTIVSFFVGAATALMLIASFVRRLHDAGYTGWIVLIPLATQAFSMLYTISYMDRIEELTLEVMQQSFSDPTGERINPYAVQAEMGLLGLVGWIGYIVVIGFGVLKSQDGPNQYGEAPASV